MRGMSKANMNLGIFQETKVTDVIYTCRLAGYSVLATDVPSQNRGRVAVFYWPAPHFVVEAVRQFELNIAGFHLATGEHWWYIVGFYLAPNDTSTIESVVAALVGRPRGTELLVAGGFNVKLSKPESDRRGEDIAAALAMEGLEDMLVQFLPHRRSWCQDRRTWSIIWDGREVISQTNYILGTDRHLFWNVSVQYLRHNSDHYMVLGCLCRSPLREHSKYLRGRKRLPFPPLTAPMREDGIFAALRRAVRKPQARDARKNAWISESWWRLVNKRFSTLRDPAKNQSLIRRLGRTIAASLKGDRQRRSTVE